jgi:uncharacterized protein (DUF362 family)
MCDDDTRVGIAFLKNQARGYRDEVAVRQTVRRAILSAGLGRQSTDAPLAEIIPRGANVLLKPNWVHHVNMGGHSGDCLVTHPSVIRAVLAEVLLAGPRHVIIGDAPIQDCNFEFLVNDAFRGSCHMLAGEVPLSFIDFRRTILADKDLVQGVQENLRPEDQYVLFDLGKDSLLEPITTKRSLFRVTKYDPRRLAERHCHGRHEFLLAREAFDVDVVINIPKLKTHGKAGLTGALKNLVGMNGNKDFLPHHRVGGSTWGGDCYPGIAPLKRLAEAFSDQACKLIGSPDTVKWFGRARRARNLHRRLTGDDGSIEGMWHGNDTCWRMVVDLNRILIYGRSDGSMGDTPQRKLFALTDAIVCGEGEGPLAPEQIYCGAITFSANSVAADLAHAALLRFDPRLIRLLRGVQGSYLWPLFGEGVPTFSVEGRGITLTDLARTYGVNARPPSGWLGHCEWQAVR